MSFTSHGLFMGRCFLYAYLIISLGSVSSCDDDNPVSPQPPQTTNFKVDAYFSKNASGQMTNLESKLIQAIQSARTSILLDMPRLESNQVISALREAKLRGVFVEICLDASSPEQPLRRLHEANVTIRTRRKESTPTFQHRFVVIDNEYVWAGSHLTTPTANGEQDHNAVFIKSQALASQFKTAFHRIYGSGDAFESITRADGAKLAVRFTPYDDAESFVASILSNATQEIRVMSVGLESQVVADALIQQAENGVSVQGVVEEQNMSLSESQYARLLAQGLDFKQDGNASEMAHQVFIIDGKTVITGSRKLNGGKGNLQHVLALFNLPGIAQNYLREYNRVRALSH